MSEPVITSFDIDDSSVRPEPAVHLQLNGGQEKAGTVFVEQEARTGSYMVSGVLFTTFILLALGFGTIKIMDPGTLPIRNVSVAGDFTHLSPVRLQQRVGDVVRGGFFSVNVDRIQQALLEEPWIREVSVKRAWPDRIIVTIREQTAVVQWGDEGLLNDEAVIFRPDHSSFPAGLPILSGPDNSSHNVLETFEHIREILPEGLSVQQLILSDRRSWELKLNAGPTIRLGKTGIMPRMQRFIEYLSADGFGSMAQIQYIDMRYTNGFSLLRYPENKAALEVTQENYGKEI